MVHTIIFKKRFEAKLGKLLAYLEKEFGLLTAQKFAGLLQTKFDTLQHHPDLGLRSATVKGVRSILAGKQNRIYYRVVKDKIIVLNIYDTRINPSRNTLR